MKPKLTRHHRLCKSHGGTGCAKNISLVPEHKHRAFHLIFGNMKPAQIAKCLSDVWVDADYQLVAIRRSK